MANLHRICNTFKHIPVASSPPGKNHLLYQQDSGALPTLNILNTLLSFDCPFPSTNTRPLAPAAAANLNLLSSWHSSFPAGFQPTTSWPQHLALKNFPPCQGAKPDVFLALQLESSLPFQHDLILYTTVHLSTPTGWCWKGTVQDKDLKLDIVGTISLHFVEYHLVLKFESSS